MTHSKFLEQGTKLVLPSGQRAVFVCWRVKLVQPGNPNLGQERIAVLRTGCGNTLHFSERFMNKVRVC